MYFWVIFFFVGQLIFGSHLLAYQMSGEEVFESNFISDLPKHDIQKADVVLFSGHSQYALGADLYQQFVRFFFPISGRERRTMFLPSAFWGPKKPQYKIFDWKEHDSKHFHFYYYPEGQRALKKVVTFLEDDYERNNRLFGVKHRFTKKIPIIFYNTRSDFEQTHIVGGPVPEGLGGLTEIFAWRRATFPFEGELSKLEHVTKHEGTHIYQIAKGARRLPLWFIEGTAETNSVYWDADAELIIRDAYTNGFFFRIRDLWQIQGTWLMYKIGNYICNLIREEFGEGGLKQIYQNASDKNFEENIQASLGVSIDELDRMVQNSLSKDYGGLFSKKDLTEKAATILDKSILLGAYENILVWGSASRANNEIFVGRLKSDGSVLKERIINDRRLNSESLNFFRKGADINKNKIVYAIKNGKNDELRISRYKYNDKKEKFSVGKTYRFSWDRIERIHSPTLLKNNRVGFIGFEDGYTNIYIYDYKNDALEQITYDNAYYDSLDYSEVSDQLVFSREMERAEDRIFYNMDLFLFDLNEKTFHQLTQTAEIRETQPRFSKTGDQILFHGNQNNSNDFYVYNLKSRRVKRITEFRVGGKNPHWAPNNAILFNMYQKLVPSIVVAQMPSAIDTLKNELPKLAEVFVEPKNISSKAVESGNNFELVQMHEKDDLLLGKYAQNKIHVYNRRIELIDGNDNYFVQRVAPFQNKVLFETFLDSEKREVNDLEVPQKVFFEWDGKQLTNLSEYAIRRDYLSAPVKERISNELFNGKAVVSGFIDASDTYVLVLVSNVLAKDADKKAKILAELYWVDLQSLKKEKIKAYQDFSSLPVWASFSEKGVLFAEAPHKGGPFTIEYFAYASDARHSSPKDNNASLISLSSNSFRAHEKGWLAWKTDMQLRMVDLNKRGKTKKLSYKGKLLGYRFVQDTIYWLSFDSDQLQLCISELSLEADNRCKSRKLKSIVPVSASISSESGNIVIRGSEKQKSDVEKRDKLILFNNKLGDAYDISARGASQKIINSYFLKEYVLFSEKDTFYAEKNDVIWSNRERSYFQAIKDIKMSRTQDFLYLLGEGRLFSLSTTNFQTRFISAEVDSYCTVNHNDVIFSAPFDGHYQLFLEDSKRNTSRQLIATSNHAIRPHINDTELMFNYLDSSNTWQLRNIPMRRLDSSHPTSDLNESKEEADYHILFNEGNFETPTYGVTSAQQTVYEGPEISRPSSYGFSLDNRPAKDIFKLQSLAGAAAFDGSNLRFLVNSFVDNIFSDQGLFINGIFLGGAKFATVGFSNLRRNYSYGIYFNERLNVKNYGASFAKDFILDRYRAFIVGAEFDIQSYGDISTGNQNFVNAYSENRNFYVAKGSAAYVIDTTKWDLHGPIKGNRLFFRSELGWDVTNSNLANVDVNLDGRTYFEVLPKFSFAFRGVAGTSQGNLPSIYLVGGNISFRGVEFDALQGQNYWVLSSDMRIPVFDFVGAKFFDPLDYILGIFTKYFDIRSGVYFDTGAVWNNDASYDNKYSLGYFVNVPTLLGINLRFSKGVFGEDILNFWIGANW